MKPTIILLALLITLPHLAEAADSSQAKELLGKTSGAPVPEPFDRLFKNERINVYVTGTGITVGAVVKDGILKSVQDGEIADPTVKVYVSQEGLTDVTTGKIGYRDLVAKGGVRVEGIGAFNSVKFAVMMFLARILLTLV
ncbi:MAG: hypothetical protein HY366_02035 [Candidatus Aenigmarchaeota archaeon]|nr:hypothetical protein [Candidatus Aenigmarchaeota archaeon]